MNKVLTELGHGELALTVGKSSLLLNAAKGEKNSREQSELAEPQFADFETVPHPSLLSLHKKVVDIAGATFLLIVCSPIFLLAAALVKITSRGTVIYMCHRIGRGGRPFVMYKFRTMKPNSNEREQSMFAQEGTIFLKPRKDVRITDVGAILRRWSIDELPQLINVLKGEMSLVGPRPILLSEGPRVPDGLSDRRFDVQPGITGLWQVSGRSALPDRTRLHLEHKYVEQWSISLDWRIILKTVFVVLRANGAR